MLRVVIAAFRESQPDRNTASLDERDLMCRTELARRHRLAELRRECRDERVEDGWAISARGGRPGRPMAFFVDATA